MMKKMKRNNPSEWIYIKNKDNTSRYALGTIGENPLFCFGINPSSAEPKNLDNTVKAVERIAKHNGYDSWIMLNLYPQRATNPNDMHKECDECLLAENIKEISKLINKYENPTIWAAWGTLIEKRSYLKQCLSVILKELDDKKCNWITIGCRSKKGHPHHPLYLKVESSIKEFNIINYMKKTQGK